MARWDRYGRENLKVYNNKESCADREINRETLHINSKNHVLIIVTKRDANQRTKKNYQGTVTLASNRKKGHHSQPCLCSHHYLVLFVESVRKNVRASAFI